MEQSSSSQLTDHPLFANNSMLNAVASLIRQHQENKEKDMSFASPMLVLTSLPGKESLHANVVMGASDTRQLPQSEEEQFPSLEQMHALARASLVASTQLDIAQQLAQQAQLDEEGEHMVSSPTVGTTSREGEASSPGKAGSQARRTKKGSGPSNAQTQRNCGKEAAIGRSMDKKTSSHSTSPTKIPESPQPRALVCSFEGCNRKFAWQNHLNYHEMTHTNNRKYTCPHENCGKSFFTAQRLSVHLRTHTGERPFKCSHSGCGKMFTTAGNLKNHERIHTGEQPFVCDVPNCKRRFTEHSSLQKHKRTHSGDKPFECPMCGKRFTQSGSRHHHMNRHKLDEEIRASYMVKEDDHHSRHHHRVEDRRKDSTTPRQAKPVGGQTGSKVLMEERGNGSSQHLACSPQVLVLNNSYSGLPTSEPIVFSHGLSDHIVTVTTHQEMGDTTERISLSQSLLNTDGLQEEGLQEKSSELVILSETPIYPGEEDATPSSDIVYATDILDHEEVACANYVTAEVSDDYSVEIAQHDESYNTHVQANCSDEVPGYPGDMGQHHSAFNGDSEAEMPAGVSSSEAFPANMTSSTYHHHPVTGVSDPSSRCCFQGDDVAMSQDHNFVDQTVEIELSSFSSEIPECSPSEHSQTGSSLISDVPHRTSCETSGSGNLVQDFPAHHVKVGHRDLATGSKGSSLPVMDPIMEYDEDPGSQ